MAQFGPVLVLSYKDEKSLGTRTVKTEMEVTTPAKKTAKKVMAEIGDKWWYVTSLFNYVVNLFSFRAKPEDAEVELEGVTERVPVEYEEQYNVPYQQGRKELKAVADRVVSSHQQLLSRPHPPSSTPGEYPARRSGTLQKSITSRWDGKSRVQVGYKGISGPTGKPIEYSQWLADTGRFSLIDTAKGLQNIKTASNRELRWEFTYEYV